MKKYIAFVGGQCSAIGTKEEAEAWAAKMLANNSRLPSAFIAEVIEVAERPVQSVYTKQFFCELNEPVTKAA